MNDDELRPADPNEQFLIDRSLEEDPRQQADLTVYVPCPNTEAWARIAPGSGVVGQEVGSGRVLVHYEGNIYNSDSLRRFYDRVELAAARHVQNYPTTARMLAPSQDFLQI